MHPAYAEKLGLSIRETGVGAHLRDFAMVIAAFSVHDETGKLRFFEGTFLMANASTLSSANRRFAETELI